MKTKHETNCHLKHETNRYTKHETNHKTNSNINHLATSKTDRNILIAFILNLSFSVLEFFGGLFTNSVAILSDSVHDLGDAFSVGLSYILERKSKKGIDARHTYGYVRYSVLGSVITASILVVSSILIIIGAIGRIITPTPVDYSGMIILAIVGVILNSIASFVTHDKGSLNQESINLHMLEDVLGWVVVLIGAIVMNFTDISIIDPIMSIGVALFILIGAFKNLHKIVDIFLEKTPKTIDLSLIKQSLLNIDGVLDVHHVHVRSIDGYNNYATLHVVVSKYSHELKAKIKQALEHQNIKHSTIELELNGEDCDDKTCEPTVHNHSHSHSHSH